MNMLRSGLRFILVLSVMLTLSGCTTLGVGHISFDKLNERYANEASRYIKVGDNLVHYRDEGEGPVILAIHGILDSLHTWDGWVDELQGDYRIIRLDLPGFGLTGPVDVDTVKHDAWAGFLHDFVNTIGLEDDFYIAGNSLGGAIAWNYAVRHPERVKKMVLIDPASYPYEGLPWPVELSVIPIASQGAKIAIPKLIFNVTAKEVFGDQSKMTPEMIERFFDLSMRRGNRSSYIDIFRELKALASSETFSLRIPEVAQHEIPTLLMWGKADAWIPYQQSNLWKRDIPDLEIILYEGVGHTPQMEIPLRTARDARTFIQTAQ